VELLARYRDDRLVMHVAGFNAWDRLHLNLSSSHSRFAETLVPLEHTEFDYDKTSLSPDEGEFLWNAIRQRGYQTSIEIGCALGVGSLYICDAIATSANPAHTIIDPHEMTHWRGIGVQNLRARGITFFRLIEESSELALPKLLEKEEQFDVGLIDGWHTLDHALLDFFYLNRLVRVGGMILFDDANWPSISKLLAYIGNYPCYRWVWPAERSRARPTLRTRVFRFLHHGTRLVPRALRDQIFSPRLVAGQAIRFSFPSIVGLEKVAEDDRNWDWYVPF
jgi:predicted O-methyltransferase YrrM